MRRLIPFVALAALPLATGCRAAYPALDEAERVALERERDSLAIVVATADEAAMAYADSLATARRAAEEAARRRTATPPPTQTPATQRPVPTETRPTPPRPAPSTPPARDPGIREPDVRSTDGPAASFGRSRQIAFVDSATVDELFQPASATLSEVGKAILDRIAYEIARQPESLHIRVEGHADSTPPGPTIRERWPSNWDLAAARASAVARYLAEKGLSESRFEVVSYGSTRPIAPNDTPQNRARNRRIVVLVG